MSVSIQDKIELYEHLYFSLDQPVPFKKEFKIYPVIVKDYNTFHNCSSCLTMDKNIMYEPNEMGVPVKKANIKGISQTYMQYLLDQFSDKLRGQLLISQFMQLMELVLHIKNGLYCPNCGKEIEYSEAFKDRDKIIEEEKKKLWDDFMSNTMPTINVSEEDFEQYRPQFDKVFQQKAEQYFYNQATICPDCKEKMQDIYQIQPEGKIKSFKIKGVRILDDDFDELKSIVLHYNINNYEGDKYIDPDLKEELEIKAKLKSGKYVAPNLEKQMACIVCGTSYTFESLQNITLRKLNLLLKTIDAKNTYYAQLQGQLSGMVTFKEDPKHWIYGDDKHTIADELTDADAFTSKFDRVT